MEITIQQRKRVMYGVPVTDNKRILEAKFKLAPFGYAYGYFDHIHYWSFPKENEDKCLNILKTIFPGPESIFLIK